LRVESSAESSSIPWTTNREDLRMGICSSKEEDEDWVSEDKTPQFTSARDSLSVNLDVAHSGKVSVPEGIEVVPPESGDDASAAVSHANGEAAPAGDGAVQGDEWVSEIMKNVENLRIEDQDYSGWTLFQASRISCKWVPER
jgi:hypothetical protein